jgi:hypothetical protein
MAAAALEKPGPDFSKSSLFLPRHKKPQRSDGVIARSEATKQSRGRPTALDRFASLAKTNLASIDSHQDM